MFDFALARKHDPAIQAGAFLGPPGVAAHPFVAGVTFAEVWGRRVEDRLGSIPAAFASLEDLIRMKEAAGRPSVRP